uniref:THAP-type domain-containing protein n=1 Tax=Rhipicephalus appendiculatus TaxID=34631 RepID=A0A131YYA6_RHIAP
MPPHRRSSGGCTERRAKPIPRRICAVPGCSTNTRNLPSPVSFHQFPSQNERREMWMKALGIQSGTNRRVCALHFHEDAFELRRDAAAYAGIRRHLRCDAIPICCTIAPALGTEHGPQDSQDNAAVSIRELECTRTGECSERPQHQCTESEALRGSIRLRRCDR